VTDTSDRAATRTNAVETRASCRKRLPLMYFFVVISLGFFIFEYDQFSTTENAESYAHAFLAVLHVVFGLLHVRNASAAHALIATCNSLIEAIDDLSRLERAQLLEGDSSDPSE
jgi:hypothetical protein